MFINQNRYARFYSIFVLKYFLKMTGNIVILAKMVKYTIDTHENASRELVNVFNVFPAWIAKNDGGATPKI